MPILLKPLEQDKNKSSILHAILFPKNKFSFDEARSWIKNHNYKYIHNRQTKNIWRFRIKEQIYGYKFYTKVLNNGIEFVYMYK